MTQTVDGQKKSTPSQKQPRPGQRQQDRLTRQARRQRRRRIWTSVIVAVVVVGVAALTFWQYQRFTTSQTASKPASSTKTTKSTATTATATTTSQIGPKCTVASSLPSVYDSTPSAGPTTPPTVTDQPATNTDGLQCIDLKVGSGPVAQQGSTVSVQYTGWLASNGQKFDSSYDRNAQAFSVTPLGTASVIQGWNEGLVGMQAGGTRRLIIPASLAYGAQGNQGIPGNATLIFDITVVSIS